MNQKAERLSKRNHLCRNCGWTYPTYYLAPMRSSAGDVNDVCGICALILSNKVLGLERTQFSGQMAEHLRGMAISWRKNHPDLAPKEEPHADQVPQQKT
jgi:hypothetical protein